MNGESGGPEKTPVLAGEDAGTQMRAARERAGLGLAEVAARTRVPLRHLEALERSDYAALPGLTYCAGFARAYARAVDLDEVALVAKIREEIDAKGELALGQYQIDEPADPARIPPRALAWAAAVIALLIAGGYALWRTQIDAISTDEPLTAQAPPPQDSIRVPIKPIVPPSTGPVVMTAVEDVWLRIYEPEGKALFENTLKRGETYTVPQDARNPMILTGRADALAITVGGRPVPPLGTAERTISDVPVSAAALLARENRKPAAGANGQETPTDNAATVPAGASATSTTRQAGVAASSAPVPAPARAQQPVAPAPAPAARPAQPAEAPVASAALSADPAPDPSDPSDPATTP